MSALFNVNGAFFPSPAHRGLSPGRLLLTGRSIYHALEWWYNSEVMLSCHLCSVGNRLQIYPVQLFIADPLIAVSGIVMRDRALSPCCFFP